MVPGFEALAVKLFGKSKYFSLPFNSFMLIVMGNLVLNSVVVALLYNVAVKAFVPMVIFSFILAVFITSLGLLFIPSFLLQQAKSWMQIKQDRNVIAGFMLCT